MFALVAEFWNPALVREPEVVAFDAIERACMKVLFGNADHSRARPQT